MRNEETANGRTIKVPHVAESAFSMECEVMHWYDVKTDKGDPANTVIIGRVKMMHVVRILTLNTYLYLLVEVADGIRKTLSYKTPMLSS